MNASKFVPTFVRLFALSLAMVSTSVAASDAVVVRPAALRADRYLDAPTLREVAAGTHVDLLRAEAGWVQVGVGTETGWMRATGIAGDAASVSALARLETGRSAPGNIVVAAGIRGIVPKASKHALIIGIDSPAAGRKWPGVDDDVESARLIASRIGVPVDNVEVVRGTAGSDDPLGPAIDRLDERVQPGDQVLVYFSGPGTSTADGARCVAAWGGDVPWTTDRLARRLAPALTVADKVMVISDAAYAPSSRGDADRTTPATNRGCASPGAGGPFPLVDAAAALGVSPLTLVQLQAAAGATQAPRPGSGGGLFTQALVDCLLGDAVDVDRSASVSVAEIAACIDRPARPGRREPNAPLAFASGNTAYSPIVGAPPPAAARPAPTNVGGASPRAAIVDVYGQRDGHIDVALAAHPSTLAIGHDAIDLTLTSSRAGYVYLVLLGSDDRSFYLLFPNDLDRDNRIAAGEAMHLPRPAWRVQAQGPAGRDTILAIVAESERDLASFATAKEGPFSVALTDAAGRAQLQWLLGRSGQADREPCTAAGARRNLAAVKSCSDAFGAAMVDVVER